MKNALALISLLIISIVMFQYFYTGSPFNIRRDQSFDIIAHRGVHQHYITEGKDVRRTTGRPDLLFACEATNLKRTAHGYLENTVESIQAAFDYGATIVEIDIRRSKDQQLVIFHDNTLDCKTNGKGKISDYSVAELKQLDVGYGYTYDNGETYPYRGKGIGGIKTLKEVLQLFPDKSFLIDNKNGNNLQVAQLIVDVFSNLPEGQQSKLYLWTNVKPFNYIKKKLPLTKRLLLTRAEQKYFYKLYILSLGLWGIPDEYKDEGLGMTNKYTRYIWGWPYRFLAKVQDAGARFYLYANNQEDFDNFSNLPVNGIVTDYIEQITISK